MSEQRPEDDERVEYVARALARSAGFHDADWMTGLTEPERLVYRRDARAAIREVQEYEATRSTDDAPSGA